MLCGLYIKTSTNCSGDNVAVFARADSSGNTAAIMYWDHWNMRWLATYYSWLQCTGNGNIYTTSLLPSFNMSLLQAATWSAAGVALVGCGIVLPAPSPPLPPRALTPNGG